MSFAEKLGQKAFAASKACNDEWLEPLLKKIMSECEAAAERGACRKEISFEVPSHFMEDLALTNLKKEVSKLGFKDVDVYCPYYQSRRSISLGWKMGSAEEKTPVTNQGLQGNCPICHEKRCMVALVP